MYQFFKNFGNNRTKKIDVINNKNFKSSKKIQINNIYFKEQQ